MTYSLQSHLKTELEQFLAEQAARFPQHEVLKIDLHCHDHNSDTPDELLGRILNVPETWLPTERLMEELEKNGCDAFTITNHNNARSCYTLQEKGVDILTGCEFSCIVPDFQIGIHVLAYGFTPEQEQRLNKLRKNIYHFQEYARKHDIPTIWAHPLYHYAVTEMPPMNFFHKMGLIFERFEVINGQRDTWQNMLVRVWVEGMTPEKIDAYAKQFDIDPRRYCANPYKKSFSAGSDSHMGIFSGLTGTYLHVPNLIERLQTEPISALALEAIRNGDMVPYGAHQHSEKLTIAFLDYVSQVATNYRDPGLLRVLLHKGSANDKMVAFLLSNIFLETQRHKVTTSFFKLFHDCIMGIAPSFLKKLIVPSPYKPIFEEARNMAKAYKEDPTNIVEKYSRSIAAMNDQLNELLFSRLTKKMEKMQLGKKLSSENIEQLLLQLDLPTDVRSYVASNMDKKESTLDLSRFLDGLSFPFFGAALILSANFTSSKVMFNTRPFLKEFSQKMGKYEHPERVLWLTDTFDDKNGTSTTLQAIHREVKRRGMPIDFVVCSDTLAQDDHLLVMKPVCTFANPLFPNQEIRIPNLLALHDLFHKNEYDRIVCSTEGVMGLMALYLKHAYSVEASFYIHTDWVLFARKVLNLNRDNQDRIRRMLRTYYGGFDKLFVLNSDQKKWLTGSKMNFKSDKVALTAHWTDKLFTPRPRQKRALFGVDEEVPVLLYVGRTTVEKGLMELPRIYKYIQKRVPTVQLVVVGQGAAGRDLEQKLPEVIYYDSLDRDKLPDIYSSADLLIYPSRYDTFSDVVLEAQSCGLPVVAYNVKGAKDLIVQQMTGYLVENEREMAEKAADYLQHTILHPTFREAAIKEAGQYHADAIMDQLVKDMGFDAPLPSEESLISMPELVV